MRPEPEPSALLQTVNGRRAHYVKYSMPVNPYASFVHGLDPLAEIRNTPSRLEGLVHSLSNDRLTASPAPGKWSARDILSHLADVEVAFGFRLRQALAEDHHVIQPFDQDGWAKTYSNYDAHAALAAFRAFRLWNLALIDGLKPGDFARPVNHPERGEMTLRTVIETMAGHDHNHLRQIESLVA